MSSNLTGYTLLFESSLVRYGTMKEILRDPIHQEVKEKLDRLGVKAVLFDLDDTLIYTQEIFNQYMEEYSAVVAEQVGRQFSEVMDHLKEINIEEYKKMGVNPARWAAVLERLAGHFPGYEQEVVGNLDILMKIYTKVPREREGARVVLGILKELGVKMILVTHANVDWTHFKLDSLGLWDYFDQVHVVNENGHKKKDDWNKAVDDIEELAENCLIVGDSLNGDVCPGDDLGARTMWICGSTWDVFRQGKVPERTVPIEGVRDMFAALNELR